MSIVKTEAFKYLMKLKTCFVIRHPLIVDQNHQNNTYFQQTPVVPAMEFVMFFGFLVSGFSNDLHFMLDIWYIIIILHQSTIFVFSSIFVVKINLWDGPVSNKQAEVVTDASVVRSGRNVTVIAVEFKMKKTSKLIYTGRATFYNMPIAKLWRSLWFYSLEYRYLVE